MTEPLDHRQLYRLPCCRCAMGRPTVVSFRSDSQTQDYASSERTLPRIRLQSSRGGAACGTYIQFLLRREDRRLRRGWTYEPPTFYETTNQ